MVIRFTPLHFLMACVGATPAFASHPPRYTVTLLADLPGNASGTVSIGAGGLNDVGQATGWSRKYDGGSLIGQRGLRWSRSGEVTELGVLGATATWSGTSHGEAINAQGEVAGMSVKYVDGMGFAHRAVYWLSDSAAPIELGSSTTGGLQYSESWAYDINDARDIVGWGRIPRNDAWVQRAIVWPQGSHTPVLLPTLTSDFDGRNERAFAVNASGTIAGMSSYLKDGRDFGLRAVRWSPDYQTVTALEVLGTDPDGLTTSLAVAINDAGDTVGWATKYIAGQSQDRRGVLWPAGTNTAIELQALQSEWTEAKAINERGDIVGEFHLDQTLAALWMDQGQTLIDLNTLIPADSGWRLETAVGISDSGVILGRGWFDPDGAGPILEEHRAFLLTPIPEPDSSAIVVAAMLCLRRRRSAQNLPTT